MRVEIWSDIVCPFCYLGKRKFEKALNNFEAKDKVEIVYRSFQLDPEMNYKPGQSVHEYLAERKGVTAEKGKQMNDQMAALAKEEGLDYRFDQAIINNTLDAHRLLHFAQTQGVQQQMVELLFAAYYTEGKNIGDHDTLASIAVQAGLDKNAVLEMLKTDQFVNEVRQDQYEAEQVGARGVPFFVFNNRYAVSGAQPPEVFTRVLEKVWEEEQPLQVNEATGFCTPDRVCN